MTNYEEIDRIVARARHARNLAVAELLADAMNWTVSAPRRVVASIAARFGHSKDARTGRPRHIAPVA